MTTYAQKRSSADDQLARNGQAVTLSYLGGGTYDPATGTTSGSAPSSETVNGAFFPLTAARYAFMKDAGVVVAGDQQLILSAQNTAGAAITAPQVNATVTDANSTAWTIVANNPLSPAGIAVMYDLIVRRAQ